MIRSPRRIAAALVAAATACTALAATTAVAAAPSADTSADLTWTASTLRVKVTSPQASCKDDRKVFYLLTDGGDTSAAYDTTNDNGVSNFPSVPDEGTMRAFVGRTPACRPAQSDSVTRTGGIGLPDRLAAARARTSATLTLTGSTARVKVTSPKAACEGGRKVDLFSYVPGPAGFAGAVSGTTNGNGVFSFNFSTAGGSAKMTAFVRGTGQCGLGQTNTLTFPLN